MSITIEIDPEVENRLRQQARVQGQEFSVYLELLLRRASRSGASPLSSWPEGDFEQTYGSFHLSPLERLPQGDYEKREVLV